MSEYTNFSSLPPHEEQAFVVYERHGAEALGKGRNLGYIVGGVLLVFMLGLYFGLGRVHPPDPEADAAKAAEEAKAAKAAAAPKPDKVEPAPAEAPKAAPAAEAPAADGSAATP